MSALAQYFHKLGYNISGYDKTKTDICRRLENLGIEIHYEDNIKNISPEFLDNNNTLIILTPAIPTEHIELNYFRNNNFEIVKRSEVLGLISNKKTGLAIAGTHGKTSVSSICAWIMSQTKTGCSAFLGGIAKNINSNLITNSDSDFVVVEADEFDRSFHQLTPSSALITCIEADHLDIYHDYKSLENAFIEFGNLTKQAGNLILNSEIKLNSKETFRSDLKIFRYGLNNKSNDFHINNIEYLNDYCYFDLNYPNGSIKKIKYAIGGNHNLENALAGASLALLNGATEENVRIGLESFEGVVRRFDIRIRTEKLVYIDDYAHHPSEIAAFLKAVKQLFPSKKITGVFQPHLYSRTKDFAEGFAKSLSLLDSLLLLPIYPAREEPITGVDSKMIYDKCTCPKKVLCEKEELISKLKNDEIEILVTMGAGDIDLFVELLTIEFGK
jgi:UDP-N-acetylmuramate--alanine ligase